MDKRKLIITPLMFLILLVSCVSQPAFFNRGGIDKKNVKIAVLPFRDYNSVGGNNSGELVRSLFESTLLRKGFQIIEVEKAAAAAEYQFLAKNEFPSKWIIETGNAIGSDYMIYGSVHDYTVFQNSTTFLYLFEWLEITASVGITARMVSCSTGEVVWSGSFTGISYTLNDAAREAVYSLVRTIREKSAR